MTLRVEGDLAAQAGDTAGARAAYERYLILRGDPDPSLTREAAAVSESLRRLAPRR